VRENVQYVGVDGRIILKLILMKYDWKAWTEFKTKTSDGLF
jgi:hypothetical protein